MSFKVYTVHDWFDVERLCPDDVKHYKTKELLVDYDSYAKLEAERDALKYELEEERKRMLRYAAEMITRGVQSE